MKSELDTSQPRPLSGAPTLVERSSSPVEQQLTASEFKFDQHPDALALPLKNMQRECYLQEICAGRIAPVIVLTGAAGAGKTTVMRLISEIREAKILNRFLPRQKRSDDVATDREWTSTEEKRGVFFAHDMYKGAYAFPTKEFSLLMKELRGDQALLIQIARGHEVAGLIEACQRIFPIAPVLSLRIDAPFQVISSRLSSRTTAEKGEIEERLAAIAKLQSNDDAESPYLERVYGQTTFLSLTADDIARHSHQLAENGAQCAPLTRETLGAQLDIKVAEAMNRSKTLAKDILRERSLAYGDRFVPDGLTDVLENLLIPAIQKATGDVNTIPALKGGTAMRFYAEATGRAVSPDIDFTLVRSKLIADCTERALNALTGTSVPMVDRWDKAQWPAYGAHAEVKSERTGQTIELDALLVSRVRPHGRGFCFEYNYDAHDHFMRRTVNLPNGGKVYIVPPEHTLLEKLAAGRGADQGKFDLFDSAGIITQCPLDPSLLHKIIASQRFDPLTLDRELAPLLTNPNPIAIEHLFPLLGIESPLFQNIVRSISPEYRAESIGAPNEKRTLSATALKQIAFLDRAHRMVQKILDDAHIPVDIGGETISTADRYGLDRLSAQVTWVADFFEHFARFETGRSDVFVRRGPATNRELETSFFEGLGQQIVRLQQLKNAQ